MIFILLASILGVLANVAISALVFRTLIDSIHVRVTIQIDGDPDEVEIPPRTLGQMRRASAQVMWS